MISSKIILHGPEARKQLKKGVDKLTKAVVATLGPKGRNVVIDKEMSDSPIVTKDGVSVAKEVHLKDKIENTGVRIARQAAMKTNMVAGDGTTTSIALLHAMFDEALKKIDGIDESDTKKLLKIFRKKVEVKHVNPIDLGRGMNIAKNIVHEYLVKNRKEIVDKNDLKVTIENIRNVATISANNDTVIGNIIAKAMEEVTQEGIIIVEEGNSIETKVEVTQGMQYENGMESPYFATNESKMRFEADKPFIFIINKNVTAFTEIANMVVYAVNNQKKDFVFIADDFTGDTIYGMIANKMRGGFNVCCVKSPSYHDKRKSILQDIATATGATVISDESISQFDAQAKMAQIGGLKTQVPQGFPPVKVDAGVFVGTCEKFIVEHNKFTIVNGGGEQEEIDTRTEMIESQLKEIESGDVTTIGGQTKDDLKKRLSKFKGGVAKITVGAATEIEMKEKRDRIDDAVAATQAAVEEGIIPGGGSAFVRASMYLEQKMNQQNFANDDQRTGYRVIMEAIKKPMQTIIDNAGRDGKEIVQTLIDKYSGRPEIGYNAVTEQFEDLYKSGVVDPVKVAKSALENAVSAASMLITTECILEEELDKDIKAKMLDASAGMY